MEWGRVERWLGLLIVAAILAGGGLVWWQAVEADRLVRRQVGEEPGLSVAADRAAGLLLQLGGLARRAGPGPGAGEEDEPDPVARPPEAGGTGSGSGAPAAGDAGPDAAVAEGPYPAGDVRPAGAVVVHVVGAVQRPGVYVLAAGRRAVDALALAGGPTDEAALEAVNLAAPVSDGQQLAIPTRKEVQTAGVTWGRSGPVDPGGSPSATPRVNVNTADQALLETLPGIGSTLARRIVAYRQAHGPFRAVEDLKGVSGIGDRKLEELRPYVTVH